MRRLENTAEAAVALSEAEIEIGRLRMVLEAIASYPEYTHEHNPQVIIATMQSAARRALAGE